MSDSTICGPAVPEAPLPRRVDGRLGGLMLAAVIVVSLLLSPTARRVSDGFGLSKLAPGALSLMLASRPIEVHADTAATLARALSAMNFRIDRVRAGAADVPRLLVRTFPGDLAKINSSDERKQIFIKAMLPLILKTNEEITEDRERILDLRDRLAAGEKIGDADRAWLADTASAYGVTSGDLDELLDRVDDVPVSIALAQAALESGWGTSRLATEGNALFGQLGDPSGPVMVSQGIAYRSFASLLDGVRSYAHNLNTNYAYRHFRASRAAIRHAAGEGHSLDGLKLLGGLKLYSERGPDYLDDVRNLIRINKLKQFDASRLIGTTPLDARADLARDPNDA